MKGKWLALLSFVASMSLLAGCGTTDTNDDGCTHEYDNACDVTCNTCGDPREVGDHVYDDACDEECNECGEERTAAHEYDNACDAECNICGEARVPGEHDYDNACDTDCNDCGDVREVGDHVYDNACDTDCNECGDVREVGDHVYDNACDADCNECSDVREVGDHVYDGNTDDTCNECGDVRELPLTGEEDVSTVLWNSATNMDTIGKGEEHWAGNMATSVVDNTAIPAGYEGDATSFFKMENMQGAYLYFTAEKPVWYYEALKGKGYKVAFDLYIETDVEFVNVGGKLWKPNTWVTRGDGSSILREGDMADGNVVLLDTLLENPETILINVWGAENSTYLTFYVGNFRIVEEKQKEVLPPLTGEEDVSTVVWNSATDISTVGRAEGSWGSTQATVVESTALPVAYTGDATSFFKLTGAIGDRVYFTADQGVEYYAALKGKGYMVAFDILVYTDIPAANIEGKNWKLNTWLTRGDGSNILVEGTMADGNVVLLDTLLENPQTHMFEVYGADGSAYFEIYVGNFRILAPIVDEPTDEPPLAGDVDLSTVVWNSVTKTDTIGRASNSWGGTQVEIVDHTAIPTGYVGDATAFFKLTGSVGDLLYIVSDYGVDYYAALKGKGYWVQFDFYMETEGEYVNSMGKQVIPNQWMTRGDGSVILREGELNDQNIIPLDALLEDPQTLMFDIWGVPENKALTIYIGNFRIVDPNAGGGEEESGMPIWNSATKVETVGRASGSWGGTQATVVESTALPVAYTGDATSFFKLTGSEGDMIYFTSDNGVEYYEALKGNGYMVAFDICIYTDAGSVNFAGKQWKLNTWMTRGDGSNILVDGEMPDGNVVLLDTLLATPETVMFDIWGAGGATYFEIYVGNFRIIDPNAGADEGDEAAWVWASVNESKTGAKYVCNGKDRDWAGTVEYVTQAGGRTGAYYKVTSTEEGTYVQCNGIAVTAKNEKSYYEELLAADPDATLTFSFYYVGPQFDGILMVNGKYNLGLINYAADVWHTISIPVATLVANYDNLINGAGDESGTLIAIGGASGSVTFYVGDFVINTTASK